MNVTVAAESGLMIRVHTDSDNENKFGTIASLSNATESLTPVSTSDLTNWYHNNSNLEDASKGGVWDNKEGALYTKITDTDGYVLKTRFAIRSATSNTIDGVKLQIVDVKAEGTTSTSELNKSIRVGIVLSAGKPTDDNTMLVYAPNRTAADTGKLSLNAYYKTADDTTAPAKSTLDWKVTKNGETDRFPLLNNKIPNTDDGLIADVYVWYEGEDADCTSYHAKSATPDNLKITVEFGTYEIPQTNG